MWLTFGWFDLAPLVLKSYVAPNLIPAEILIVIIIDTMIEDGPVAIRYDAPLDKALEPTYQLSLSSALFSPVSSIVSQLRYHHHHARFH